ncbi:MAG: 2-oxoglutarate dehydrogenase E1 subunit family protein, partial [Lapillicoccus sp.]
MAAFGPNEWLVDELYHRYLADKSTVDQAWWEFFAD